MFLVSAENGAGVNKKTNIPYAGGEAGNLEPLDCGNVNPEHNDNILHSKLMGAIIFFAIPSL